MHKDTKSRITGKQATYVALAAAKYPPVSVGTSEDSSQSPEATQTTPNLPAPVDRSAGGNGQRKPPPRLRKPSPMHNQCLSPTGDLDSHRARLREAFGNTMSDEFVDRYWPILNFTVSTCQIAIASITAATAGDSVEVSATAIACSYRFFPSRLTPQTWDTGTNPLCPKELRGRWRAGGRVPDVRRARHLLNDPPGWV